MKKQIKKDMVTAMKEKNEIARDTLRVLMGEIQRNEQSSKGKVELSDSNIVKLVKKLIESIDQTGVDEGEIAVLSKYLPKQMSVEEMSVIATNYAVAGKLTLPKDMGKVMGYFKQNYDGTYDGKTLSEIVRKL